MAQQNIDQSIQMSSNNQLLRGNSSQSNDDLTQVDIFFESDSNMSLAVHYKITAFWNSTALFKNNW